MTTTENGTTDVRSIEPIGHAEAMRLLAVELDRTLDLLRSLSDDGWKAPTDCPDWNVHQMYLHVLGACESGASLRENIDQMRAAMKYRRQNGGPLEAALSAVQVGARSDIGPERLVDRLAEVAPATVRQRTKLPRGVRMLKMTVDGPVHEKWALGYLVDVIYLRDLWMHRVDAARATGVALELTAAHDGRIVADVVAEWARRHEQPFSLALAGPAGGSFVGMDGADGAAVPAIEMDAVEFCRVLAGRGAGTGLLATIVPF
jgi:uncharacterized protein (TIGR03083 family)